MANKRPGLLDDIVNVPTDLLAASNYTEEVSTTGAPLDPHTFLEGMQAALGISWDAEGLVERLQKNTKMPEDTEVRTGPTPTAGKR